MCLLRVAVFRSSGGLKALARSMPTSAALDLVAKKLGVPLFEAPVDVFAEPLSHIRVGGAQTRTGTLGSSDQVSAPL